MATLDWQALTALTGGAAFDIERVRLADRDVALEGRFELPPLARLTAEDQVFVVAFVRCHGSIKQMEKFFGVSYPTIKNRLNRIGALMPFALVRAGVRLGALMPRFGDDKVAAKLREKGLDIDWSKLDAAEIERVLGDIGELTVDIDQGKAQVRITAE